MPLINFSGLASGIDSNALIQATSDASRQQRVTPKQNKIKDLEGSNEAFESLTTKLEALRSAAKSIATISGGAIAKTGVSSNEAVATATASPSANTGSYSLTVSQLAKSATYSFADRFGGTSSVIDATINDGAPDSPDRTMAFTIGNGTYQETVNVILTSTSTVADFVTQFNQNSARAIASAVNVGTSSSPSYAIMITTNDPGTEKGQIVSVTRGVGISTINPASASHDSATDAQFTLSGIAGTITRSSNKVSDVITGVTFAMAATGSTTINITDDADTTTTNVKKVVDAYNEIITLLGENNTITREQEGREVTNVFGPLAGTQTDERAAFSLRNAIASTLYGSGSTVRILADLGITTERDGTLKFDENRFKSAVSTEPSSANRVLTTFTDTISVTGGTIDVITRFNGLIDTSINSNKSIIESLNDQIATAEAAIARTEESMRAQFARLESIIGRLQQQQSALTSALSGLSR